MCLENSSLDVLNEEETSSSSEKEKEDETEVKPDVNQRVLTKKEMDKCSKNMICPSLSNLVLRKVMKQTTSLGVGKHLRRIIKQRPYQTETT